MNIPQIIHCST